ncbi:hypothetical protein P3W45_000997 [Vairimorpha bombi]
MKVSSLVIYSQLLVGVLGAGYYNINTGISRPCDEDMYGRNRFSRGRYFGGDCRSNLSGRLGRGRFGNRKCLNDSLLVPFSEINGRVGAYSKKNLLISNFVNLQDYLRNISGSNYNSENSGTFDRMLNSSFEIGKRIYTIFRNCIYLVRAHEYIDYKHKFEERKFGDCFYILIDNVSLNSFVFEYCRTLKHFEEQNYPLGSNFFYQAREKSLVEIDLNVRSNSSICSADLLNDPKSILEINLYDRIKLMEFFIQRYFYTNSGYNNEEKVRCFIRIYEEIYLRGCPLDHQVTAFVLYKLYAELRFNYSENCVIELLTRFLVDYKEGTNIDVAEIFCALAFGTVGK